MFLCPFCSRELSTMTHSCCCGAMNESCNHEGAIAAPVVGMKGRHKIVRMRKQKPQGSMVKIWVTKTDNGTLVLHKCWKIIKEIKNG